MEAPTVVVKAEAMMEAVKGVAKEASKEVAGTGVAMAVE